MREREKESERERAFRVGYSELACSVFVSVKINGFGNFLEQPELYTLTAFERLESCEGRIPF